MPTIHLELVTPQRRLVSVDTDEVIAPGARGLFGVRPGHAPFLSTVTPGELSFRENGELQRYAVGHGFVEVSHDRVRILADTAERAEEIDLERARRAHADALQKLAALKAAEPEFELQRARLERATARLHVANKARS